MGPGRRVRAIGVNTRHTAGGSPTSSAPTRTRFAPTDRHAPFWRRGTPPDWQGTCHLPWITRCRSFPSKLFDTVTIVD